MDLPTYDELAAGPSGGRVAWHLFGEQDNVGMVNLQTPERIREAAGLVRKGAVFPLNVSFDLFRPSLVPQRPPARHSLDVIHKEDVTGFDDVLDNFNPQANSQWDSLAHASYDARHFYNGVSEEDVVSGLRNGIEHWAQRGIAGRGVVLDLESVADYNRGSSYAFTVAEIEAAREKTGLTYRPGDILILNTGFAQWYSEQEVAVREAFPSNLATPGVEHSEEMAAYLWNAHPSAIVTDTFAVEVWPVDFNHEAAPFGFMHQSLIGAFGIALGELWWLVDLVADCRGDDSYECLITAAPLNVPGGIGSTANALALK